MKKFTTFFTVAAIVGASLSANAYNIYIDNQVGYAETALYAWGDAEAFGGWPGITPSGTQTVDGTEYLKFECPATADGLNLNLIFNNNNNGSQLADYNVTLDKDYYFVAAGSNLVLAEDWNGEIPDGHILYVDNQSGWNPLYIYAYDPNGGVELFGGWPGKTPFDTKVIDGVSYDMYQMVDVKSDYVIIANDNNGSQFDGPVINSGADVYMIVGTDSESTTVIPTPGATFHNLYINDQTGWDAFYVYAWGTGLPELFGGWPGVKATEKEEINGISYYVIPFEASDNTYNLIFNNNDGTQYDVMGIVCDKDYYFTANSDSFTSAVEKVEVMESEEAVYYNMQGIRVATPTSGLYIKVSGNKAEKVLR